MASENKNTNELVSADDDPTAELEIITLKEPRVTDSTLEMDAKTYGVERPNKAGREVSLPQLESDLRSHEKTNTRLQFDIEQLRAKWLGLESEIKARESQTTQLNKEMSALQATIASKEKLIRKRDQSIRSLKSEIRQRDEEHRALSAEFSAFRQARQTPEPPVVEDIAPAEVSAAPDYDDSELLQRLNRSEEYADTLRQQLQDRIELTEKMERERERVEQSLADVTQNNRDLSKSLGETETRILNLESDLDTIERRHQDDMRMLRFELGEAQNTAVESENLSNKLSADLEGVRGAKEALEKTLLEAQTSARARIEKLQKDLKKISRKSASYEQKLTTKSEAISVLLAELAKKSELLESIGEIEEVIHDIDDRITERFSGDTRNDIGQEPPEDAPATPESSERITRLLVGTIDDQTLRFPLFKDQLTVGRTRDNDIQLKAAYISRRHALLQIEGDTTRIIDWGSKNGIYVNADRIKEHNLKHGDAVTIGRARFRYEELRKRD